MHKKGSIFAIIAVILLAIVAYGAFLFISHSSCTKTQPAACEINTCKFSLAGSKLVTSLKDNCCGNKKCELNEDYLNCLADCKPPLRAGEVEANYEIKDSIIQIDGKVAKEKGYKTNFFQDTFDTAMVRIPLYFDNNADTITVNLRCSQEGRALFSSFETQSGSVQVMDGSLIYLLITETSLICKSEASCTQYLPYAGASSTFIPLVETGGEAVLELPIQVTDQETTPVISCTAEFSCKNPAQLLEKEFKFVHTKR